MGNLNSMSWGNNGDIMGISAYVDLTNDDGNIFGINNILFLGLVVSK
jgi:hypothetical protein